MFQDCSGGFMGVKGVTEESKRKSRVLRRSTNASEVFQCASLLFNGSQMVQDISLGSTGFDRGFLGVK